MHHSTQRATVSKLVRTFLQFSRQQQQHQQQTHALLLHSLAASATACCSQQHPKQQFLSSSSSSTYPTFLMPTTSSATIKLQRQQQQQPPLRLYSKFTAAREPTVLGSHPLCEERAHDLVSNLKDSERAAIKLALEKYDAMRQKEGFEGKLAATQWRTRFGRLSKMPALGEVDPTGSFCAFPDDWLKKKAAEKAKAPTSSELWRTFFVNAVPFVAFGFLDNFTMIVAGDYIEHVFGTFMCISTMAAAGFGNTISDVLGIGSAFYVERGCEFLGLRPPDLTAIQMEMKSTRRAANYGRIIGITVGCLVGMFPLLFMDKKPTVKDPAADENVLTAAAQPE